MVKKQKVPTTNRAKNGAATTAKPRREVITRSDDPHAFSVEVTGPSMEPDFRDGDLIVFEPTRKPQDGDAVLVKLKDGRTFFKWFGHDADSSEIVLMSENESFEPIVVDSRKIEFIYPAKEMIRTIKRKPFIACKIDPQLHKQVKDSAALLGIRREDLVLKCLERGLPAIAARGDAAKGKAAK